MVCTKISTQKHFTNLIWRTLEAFWLNSHFGRHFTDPTYWTNNSNVYVLLGRNKNANSWIAIFGNKRHEGSGWPTLAPPQSPFPLHTMHTAGLKRYKTRKRGWGRLEESLGKRAKNVILLWGRNFDRHLLSRKQIWLNFELDILLVSLIQY